MKKKNVTQRLGSGSNTRFFYMTLNKWRNNMQEPTMINSHITTSEPLNKKTKTVKKINPSLLEIEKDLRQRFINEHERESRAHYDYSDRDHIIYIQKLKQLAKERGYTQTKIYTGIEINQAYLSRVWRGQKEVKKSLITKLAKFFDVPFSDLGEKIKG